ncbi:SDR family NAD(P)-dependent oxidoreductase [Silvibacterium dinghuense]|uniref:SDR family NAD(P)-dependent oxidoreductase n=1 Tax=Silvibacterium dinghuense TaxID=1560006 RepID=A0A4Q1SHQ8_9BACT|nr:SDR family NAD(P)-dependent oxidoreductase [Silvibacterium dinghuense]RXS96929.1 SDR family NAD(P)-dependent oxidoreductase [Silvibacterium dinghuense]GGG94768.1 short-chain dehydrogenase/reductase [Silvibacterium dinghuense]
MSSKVWLITGASRGMGRIWAEAALKRGDKVAATARKAADVADLAEKYGDAALPLALEPTDAAQVGAVVEQAHAHFGRLDVVLNNAAYPLIGTMEEAGDDEVQAQFDTNVFGPHRVIKAALPLLRKQGSGHIIGVSSTLGVITLPLIGFYCASKWAFEAMHESLAKEVRGFGIDVTIIEPGAYATEFGGPQSGKRAQELEVYAPVRKQVYEGLTTMERGDPRATAEAVLKLVDAEHPPLRLMLGDKGLPQTQAVYAERLATWEAWKDVADAAQGVSVRMSDSAH